MGARSRRTVPEPTDYNLKLRAITFKANAGLRAEFNDNINLSENHEASDIILTPYVDVAAFWPITPFNSLSLTTSLGYRKYLDHSELDSSTILIAPDSELNFDIFVGNFVINLHDRFSIQQDPVGEATLSNVAEFGRFTNTAGIGVTWNINSTNSLFAGYDHTDFISTNSRIDFADYAEDQLSLSTRHVFQDNLWGGLEGGVASTRYRTGEKADAVTGHAGLYAETILTPYTRLRVAGGAQFTEIDGGSEKLIGLLPSDVDQLDDLHVTDELGTNEGSDATSYYWNLELSNRLTQFFSHSLSAGRESQLAITAQRVEFFFARYQAAWNLNRVVTLNGNLFYENGQEYGSETAEDFQRFGAGISTSYQLSRKLGVAVGYNFFVKDSNLESQSYTNNRVFLQLNYDF